MLRVQEYLRSGKTPEDLSSELGIKSVRHPTLPLVILNYSQIDSPKIHPVVRECRGLVLEDKTWNLVARGFPRFFNWGEHQEELALFDFSDCIAQSKEDGSLVLIYYYNKEWRANTRGSFALDQISDTILYTWKEIICKALEVKDLQELDALLDQSLTYVCELCSPYNKVVRRYQEPKIYLLTTFYGEREQEHNQTYSIVQTCFNFKSPDVYSFTNIEQVQAFLQQQSETDPTFEGVVLRDKNNHRWKVKSPTYLSLHRMSGNGNVFLPKNLLPFVLSGEESELLSYFPEVSDVFAQVKDRVNTEYQKLEELWSKHWQIESQKEFALAIVGKTPFTSILFTLRKQHGKEQTPELFKQLWRNSEDTILKNLFEH